MSPTDSPEETRASKRVRLACSNCRRKKVRCSGERPTCSFCEKLSQPCQYIYCRGSDKGQVQTLDDFDGPSGDQSELLARVALLESRLTEMTPTTAIAKNRQLDGSYLSPASSAPTNSHFQATEHRQNMGGEGNSVESLSFSTDSQHHSFRENAFSGVPPQSVMVSACDTFFLNCHNQPYTFFHEATFRQKLKDQRLPNHLLYAFLAAALRYSADPFFMGNQIGTLERYAKSSWDLIVSHGFVIEESDDISIVQSISLLAIIDSAAGRRRAAWVKIGLAVRISQDIGLMAESNSELTIAEQEERRRLFWSVYLLDRFVSCSRQRPSVILNEDCHVSLPCDEDSFRSGIAPQTMSLVNMISGKKSPGRPGAFCLAILMASALGRSARYSLDISFSDIPLSPWDPKSEYVLITSMLTSFESLSEIGKMSITEVIESEFTINGIVDQHKAGHFVLQHALFHLSHCLLNHPFLLRQRIESIEARAPASWLTRAWTSCLEHARSLSSLFRDAEEAGCIVSTSFYGYCTLISGGIHALNVNSENEIVREDSMGYLTFDVHFLEGLSTYWKNTALITAGLKFFWTTSPRYRQLITTEPKIQELEENDLKILWSIVDYGIMSDPCNLPSYCAAESLSAIISQPELDISQAFENAMNQELQ